MTQSFYVTTPIYYVNARPHLGHSYTTIVADVANRFNSMRQVETFFLTGTDEHGDKIMRAAKKEGLSPRAYVDKISGLFKDLWPALNIGYDHFVRTTDPSHIEVVELIMQKIYHSGDIYFSEYEGLYCFGCERFYTERELVNGKCPDHETRPDLIKESNYFFKMSRYQDWLVEHIKKNPEFIRPERYKNEVLSFLKVPLEDLCISRPKSRLEWGITLPFDSDYVIYVWFDALLNYVSALNYPNGEKFKTFWRSANHIIAKDILKPHGVYWPIMLKAAGIPIYKRLNVHGYWNVDQSKMSKSIGNVVEPLELKNIYGLDAFRYFLLRDMVFGLDSNFSEEALVQRINSDLANDLGNLFSRVMTMAHKYFAGVVPGVDTAVKKDSQLGLEAAALHAVSEFEKHMEGFVFHKALIILWDFIAQLNKYIDDQSPWVLAKDESNRSRLEVVIYNLLESLRIVSGLIYPVMPGAAKAMQDCLGMDSGRPFYSLEVLKTWGNLPPGTRLGASISLFPRIDVKKGTASASMPDAPTSDCPEIKPDITMDQLGMIDLRVATVIDAEAIPKAKKLLKLDVDMGERRTIVAGISENYKPKDIIGKQVVIVANLKPAKLMGVVSNGMLMAAVDGSDIAVATLDRKVKPGSPLT